MIKVFLVILFPLIFITQIAYLVYSIVKRKNKNWIGLFVFEILCIALATALEIYFSKTSAGLFGTFFEYLICLVTQLSYLLVLFVTSCIKIVLYEQNLKVQNKSYVNPFCLILATCFIFSGILMSGYEVLTNLDLAKTKGTIVEVDESSYIGDDLAFATISYEVDDEKFEDTVMRLSPKVGDIVEIYYDADSSSHEIEFKTDTKILYIPAYLFGLLIIIFRFTHSNKEKEKKEVKKK